MIGMTIVVQIMGVTGVTWLPGALTCLRMGYRWGV